MPGSVMRGVFGSGSIGDYIQSLERRQGLNSKILLSDTAQLFDAPDARSNFEPIMKTVRDLNELDDS